MLRRALRIAIVAVLVCSSAGAQENELAARLPAARVLLYGHAPMARLVPSLRKMMVSCDPEQAAVVAEECEGLHRDMQRWLARAHEFRPALLDHIWTLDHHWVVMRRDEPLERQVTVEVPERDARGNRVIGRTRTVVTTRRVHFVFSYVIATPSDTMARDFTKGFLAFRSRLHAQEAEGARPFEEMEASGGRLWRLGPKGRGGVLGRSGRYITFSTERPDGLWEALQEPADHPLAEQTAYRRMDARGPAPVLRVLFSPQVLVKHVDAQIQARLKELRDRVEVGYERERPALQAAEQRRVLWHVMRRLLSLDKLEHIGLCLLDPPDRPRLIPYALLAHGEGLSPLAQALVQGAGAFRTPPLWDERAMLGMVRLDWQLLYRQVIAHLQAALPREMAGYGLGLRFMRNKFGADPPAVVGQFAPDAYAMIRLKKREAEVARDEYVAETDEFRITVSTELAVLPELTLLWGLNAPDSTRELLARVYRRVSALPKAAPFVDGRTFMDQAIYCVGPGVSREDTVPDGTGTFALAVAGRYLCLGSWERVTALVQGRDGARSGELPALVRNNPDANFMLYMTGAAQEHMRDLADSVRPEGAADELIPVPTLGELSDGLGDEEFARRVRARLERLAPAFRAVLSRAQSTSLDALLKGRHGDQLYEFIVEEYD